MTSAATPAEVRIEHAADAQIRTANLLLGSLVVLAIVVMRIAVAAGSFVLPLGAVVAAGLVAWGLRLRRPPGGWQPWVLVVTPERLVHTVAGGEQRIERADTTTVVIAGPVLGVTGTDGGLLRLRLPDRDDAGTLRTAFEQWGWPVTDGGSPPR